MRKAIKKLRDLVADLKTISADALKESDRLIAKIDHEIARKAAPSRSKRKKAARKPNQAT
jgi:hypothetical protein